MTYNSYQRLKAIVEHEMPAAWDEIQEQQLTEKSLLQLKILAITLFSHSLEGWK